MNDKLTVTGQIDIPAGVLLDAFTRLNPVLAKAPKRSDLNGIYMDPVAGT